MKKVTRGVLNKTGRDREAVRLAILNLLRRRDPRKTICPSEAARQVFDSARWREKMPLVRDVAVDLVRGGQLEICQGGRVVDPDNARGPIRLRLSESIQ